MKFRKKPVVIEAVHFTLDNKDKAYNFIEGVDKSMDWSNGSPIIKIATLEGVMEASLGDWIIKGVNNEFYPCKPDIFQKTYDLIETDDGFKLADGMKYTFYKDVTEQK